MELELRIGGAGRGGGPLAAGAGRRGNASSRTARVSPGGAGRAREARRYAASPPGTRDLQHNVSRLHRRNSGTNVVRWRTVRVREHNRWQTDERLGGVVEQRAAAERASRGEPVGGALVDDQLCTQPQRTSVQFSNWALGLRHKVSRGFILVNVRTAGARGTEPL